MWALAENYPRAVQLYLKVRSDEALEKAIGVVEKVSKQTFPMHGMCLVC